MTTKKRQPTKEVTNRHIMKRLDKLDKRLDHNNALMNAVKRLFDKVVERLDEGGMG